MADVALFGYGKWGKNIARVLHELGRLAVVVEGDPARRDACREALKDIECIDIGPPVLERPDIRAAVFATPAATHARLAGDALEAGKDVFVEKPMCLNEGEGKILLAQAEKSGRTLMVGHLLLYHPAVRKLKELVDRGDLGRIQYIYSNRVNLGTIRVEENSFWSFAPHDISVINHLLDESPAWVHAEGQDVLTQSVRDITISTLGYPSGVRAHIFVSWLHPYKEQRLVVIGEKQMVVFSDTDDDKLVRYPHEVKWVNREPVPVKAEGEPVPFDEDEPLKAEVSHFLDCVDSGTRPLTDGQNGYDVVSVLAASDRSCASQGERIYLKPVTDENAPFLHPTAVVDPSARLGSGTKVWHFSHVMGGAQLGDGCSLGQNVHVGAGVRIGNNVKVQNNVSLYSGVEVEDDVFLGPSCVLTNVTNPRSQIVRRGLYEKTLLRRGASVGANATIVCGSTIGRYAFVAAGAVVTGDVPDYALMMGVPARRTQWISRHGVPLSEPNESGVMTCPESGLTYREVEPEQVRCLDVDEEDPLPMELSSASKPYASFK